MGKLFLSTEEVAQYLGVSKRDVYNLCKEGKIPCTKIGQHWRIHREKLEQWASKVC